MGVKNSYMYPVIFSIGSFTLYTFGVFAFLGLLFASFVIWKRGRENHILDEDIFDAVGIVSLVGLFGARLFYVLMNFERFGLSPLLWLSILRHPGMVFSGALILGSVALWVVSKRKSWEFFTVSDIAVTGLSLGQTLGWIGAFFSGFGSGKVVRRFGVRFVGEESLKFPLQIVWVFFFLVLFIILWKVENRYRTFEWYRSKRSVVQTGFLTFTYLIAYGVFLLAVASFGSSSVYLYQIPLSAIFGWVFLVIGVVGLYLRSGRVMAHDSNQVLGVFYKLVARGSLIVRQSSRRLSLIRRRRKKLKRE